MGTGLLSLLFFFILLSCFIGETDGRSYTCYESGPECETKCQTGYSCYHTSDECSNMPNGQGWHCTRYILHEWVISLIVIFSVLFVVGVVIIFACFFCDGMALREYRRGPPRVIVTHVSHLSPSPPSQRESSKVDTLPSYTHSSAPQSQKSQSKTSKKRCVRCHATLLQSTSEPPKPESSKLDSFTAPSHTVATSGHPSAKSRSEASKELSVPIDEQSSSR